MKNNEKWHSHSTRLDYTRFKLITGTLLSVVLIVTIGYIIYGSFQRILFSLDQLSTPRRETHIVQELAVELSGLQNSASTYVNTLKYSDLEKYKQNRMQVNRLIDSLRNSVGKKDYYEKIDSLDFFFNQYILSLDEWMSIRKSNPRNTMNQLYATIEKGDASLVDNANNIPHSEITTITTTVEKPVIVYKEEKAVKEGKNKNFLKRFFRGNKVDKQVLVDTLKTEESIHREVTTETMHRPDSNYYHKVDTLLDDMKASLTLAEIVKNNYNRKLKKRVIQLLNNNMVLISKVNHLLRSIDKEEQALAQQKVMESKSSADASYHKLVWLSAVGGFLALLFVYLIFMDISRSLYYKRMLQEATDKAQKLAKVKEDFLANMSHEIRTPLNSIIGYVDQLNRNGLKGKKNPPLKVLESSSQHLLNLVNDILDYSKIESGAIQLETIGFSADDVANETLHVLQSEADRKGLQLIYHPGPGLHEILRGDPVRLKQVLLNLIGNGIKFTEKGYVELHLSVLVKADGSYLLKGEVRDSGIGIEKEKMTMIFDEFSQGDTSITRKYGGTGLGLSICKQLIEMQQGHIQVQSKVGEETLFYFEIPYAYGEQDEYKVQRNEEYGDQLELQDKKVLIIDDDELSHVLLKPVFEQWRMKSTFCVDPSKAWVLLQKEVYDLVILDLQMPVLDGWEMIRRIRLADSSINQNVRILVCTANVLLNDEEIKQNVNGLLYKPFRYTQLWHALITVFDLSTDIGSVHNKKRKQERTPDHATHYSLINVMMFANGDQEQLMKFIQTFISCGKSDLDEIYRCLRVGDLKQIGEIAHKLKNMCGQLEAKQVLSALHKLELLVDDQQVNKDDINELVNKLQVKLELLFQSLEKEISQLKLLQNSRL
ncbi:MAG: response regulator [Cytophagaceae bacterium]|nr:response regulator [Cytophagaceae bacterium]